MRRYGHLLLIGLLVLSVVLAGCSGFGGNGDDADADQVGDQDEQHDGTDQSTGSAARKDDASETEDQRGAETERASERQVSDRVQVISTTGTRVRDGTVGVVNVTVAKAPGAGDIDLGNATVQWVGSSGSYTLVGDSPGAPAADGHFGITGLKDDDGSVPVVNAPDDRMVLTFDVGSDDLAADGTDGSSAFGKRLSAGSSATLQITTQSGATTTLRLVVPESLDGKAAVSL